jgi:hypothetical protein
MSQQTSLTSLVYNVPYAKQLGVPRFYYRYRSCNPNFPNRTQTSVGGFTPADQYQKLKLIQNNVSVYGSLYVDNLGALTAYKKPISDPSKGLYGVCWNQMSDRPVPSVQRATIPTGFNISTINRRHTSVTSSRPGCQTPGGVGCDIKHNSYDRYLNRLKGKGPMRRGVVPPNFGKPIPFNPAIPIYGGKTMKTNIVDAGCDCPISTPQFNEEQDIKIYNNPLFQPYPSGNLSFNDGDFVYAIKTGTNYYSRAIVTSVSNSIYTIQFDDGSIQDSNIGDLLIYFPCNCTTDFTNISVPNSIYLTKSAIFGLDCSVPINSLLINN